MSIRRNAPGDSRTIVNRGSSAGSSAVPSQNRTAKRRDATGPNTSSRTARAAASARASFCGLESSEYDCCVSVCCECVITSLAEPKGVFESISWEQNEVSGRPAASARDVEVGSSVGSVSVESTSGSRTIALVDHFPMRLQSSLKNSIAGAVVVGATVLAQGCASTSSTVMQQGSARGALPTANYVALEHGVIDELNF